MEGKKEEEQKGEGRKGAFEAPDGCLVKACRIEIHVSNN